MASNITEIKFIELGMFHRMKKKKKKKKRKEKKRKEKTQAKPENKSSSTFDAAAQRVQNAEDLKISGLLIGFGRLCSEKKHIMLLAVLIFFRNYAKIMLLSENYALCHRNYAT